MKVTAKTTAVSCRGNCASFAKQTINDFGLDICGIVVTCHAFNWLISQPAGRAVDRTSLGSVNLRHAIESSVELLMLSLSEYHQWCMVILASKKGISRYNDMHAVARTRSGDCTAIGATDAVTDGMRDSQSRYLAYWVVRNSFLGVRLSVASNIQESRFQRRPRHKHITMAERWLSLSSFISFYRKSRPE